IHSGNDRFQTRLAQIPGRDARFWPIRLFPACPAPLKFAFLGRFAPSPDTALTRPQGGLVAALPKVASPPAPKLVLTVRSATARRRAIALLGGPGPSGPSPSGRRDPWTVEPDRGVKASRRGVSWTAWRDIRFR